MERILKYIAILTFLLFSGVQVFASGEQLSLSTLVTAQNISFENCTKVFNTDNVSLFYLTIAAINANRFAVD